jgi:hypothetical protein
VLRTQAAVLVVALWLATLSLDASASGGWRALRVTAGGVIVVPVELDGEGPFPFLIDTGSSRSAISSSLARRLGARPMGETTVLTPAGRVVRPLTPLPRLSLDGSPPAASLAMILPDEDLMRGVPADGLIGADVLTRFVMTIDYGRSRITWGKVHTPELAVSLPLTVDNGRLVLSIPHPGCRSAGCPPFTLIPDTGADAVVLFKRRGGPPAFVTPLADVPVRSLAGVRTARRVLIDAASLQDLGLGGQIAALVDLPAADGLGVDGLLPLHLFSRVTLDGPAKRLTLVPR